MEQRALRLGDLVDDYCPRERRVTDHVIVAMVDDAIRQTRCSACEAEHEYKEARMPRKKTRLEDGSALTGGVLVVPKPAPANGHAADNADAPPAAASPNSAGSEVRTIAAATAPATRIDDAPAPATEADSADGAGPEPAGAWIGHRPLIRATLPKTENDVPPPRAIPEFTMHQRQGRGFGGGRGFRPHGFGGHAGNNGSGPMRGDGNMPDGNRAPGPAGPGGGGPGGKGRHRRRHRRPR
jgi:hypothetical protein